jgi:preprotein translocase subunit YajC
MMGMGMGMGRGMVGTVTEAAADHYTIKTELGEIYTIHYSVNTRVVKQPAGQPGRGQGRGQGQGEGGERTPPQAIKATDIKVGDAIGASGEVDANAKSVGAVFVVLIDPERAKEMRAMEANYGKTWLMGRVTAINEVKVSLEGGPDHVAHTFVADENTTFRKRRDPVTLADVQIGDMVRVEGAVKKDGVFVATTVAVMSPPPDGPQGNAGAPAQPPAPPQ